MPKPTTFPEVRVGLSFDFTEPTEVSVPADLLREIFNVLPEPPIKSKLSRLMPAPAHTVNFFPGQKVCFREDPDKYEDSIMISDGSDPDEDSDFNFDWQGEILTIESVEILGDSARVVLKNKVYEVTYHDHMDLFIKIFNTAG